MQYYIKTEYIIRQICKYFSLINLSRSTLFPELFNSNIRDPSDETKNMEAIHTKTSHKRPIRQSQHCAL